MKNLKNIYILLITLLMGFFSFACSDDDSEQIEEKNCHGKSAASEIVVNIGVPDILVDLETRATVDRANINTPKPENGGKFQNLVLVLADKSNKVYDIRCQKWYGEDGPSEDSGVESCSVKLSSHGITEKDGVVFAFGNVSAEVYDIISEYRVGVTKSFSELPELNKLMNATISADNLYNLNFTSKTGSYKIDNEKIAICAGMPMNAMASAELNGDGGIVFNVKMKRVCARMQIKLINNNGGNGWANNIYLEEFVIKNILASSSNYFCDRPVSNIETEDFSFLQAFNYVNDHSQNKITGENWEYSMYVFESYNGVYNYDIKVDKGQNLGNSTRYFEKGNAYVLWNRQRQRALGCDQNRILCVEQYDATFNKYANLFWELEEDVPGTGIYALRHYPMDGNSLYVPNTNNYLARQSTPILNSPLSLGVAQPTDQNKSTAVQYVYFRYSENGECSVLFCNGPDDIDHKLDNTRYRYLTIPDFWPRYLENCCGKKNTGPTEHADWALYSKYIIKKGEVLKESVGDDNRIITKVKRNNNYEMTFTVTVKSEVETYLYVKNGDLGDVNTYSRDQHSLNFEETQK